MEFGRQEKIYGAILRFKRIELFHSPTSVNFNLNSIVWQKFSENFLENLKRFWLISWKNFDNEENYNEKLILKQTVSGAKRAQKIVLVQGLKNSKRYLPQKN